MAINFDKHDQKEKELVPAGSHRAVLYSIVEIGHIDNPYYNAETGEGFPTVHKARLTWEVSDEKREFNGEQKPMVIGREYTISLGDKANLKPIVDGMTGGLSDDEAEGFDFRTLLGKPCLISVVHKTTPSGNKYASVASASQLPKGMEVPKQFNPSQWFDWNEGYDEKVFGSLPQFMKEKLQESEEYKKKAGDFEEQSSEELLKSQPF